MQKLDSRAGGFFAAPTSPTPGRVTPHFFKAPIGTQKIVGGHALTDSNPLYVVCDERPVFAYCPYTVSSSKYLVATGACLSNKAVNTIETAGLFAVSRTALANRYEIRKRPFLKVALSGCRGSINLWFIGHYGSVFGRCFV